MKYLLLLLSTVAPFLLSCKTKNILVETQQSTREKAPTAPKKQQSKKANNNVYLWSNGSLLEYNVPKNNVKKITNSKRESYSFDPHRSTLWMYKTQTEGETTTGNIEYIDLLNSESIEVFAKGISSDFTEVRIEGAAFLYDASMMSEGLCYTEILSPSPCNIALVWDTPKHIDLKKENGIWTSKSGTVLGGEWLDANPRQKTSWPGSKSSKQPLPEPASECTCWGEEMQCGSAAKLMTGNLHLVTIGVSCGDLAHPSCALYDADTKTYISFAKEKGSTQITASLATTDNVENIETNCALVESAQGGWFVMAEGMFCQSTAGQLQCQQLEGHIAAWSPDLHSVKATY